MVSERIIRPRVTATVRVTELAVSISRNHKRGKPEGVVLYLNGEYFELSAGDALGVAVDIIRVITAAFPHTSKDRPHGE